MLDCEWCTPRSRGVVHGACHDCCEWRAGNAAGEDNLGTPVMTLAAMLTAE
jgi:hypothetical protein